VARRLVGLGTGGRHGWNRNVYEAASGGVRHGDSKLRRWQAAWPDLLTAAEFHRGETVAFNVTLGGSGSNPGVMTIAYGWGAQWTVHQIASNSGSANQTWKRTDPSSSRARGAPGGEPHRLVPGALHFMYVSPLNDIGNFDWYTYVDTIFPIHGVHPYTRDRWSGQAWVANDAGCTEDGALVADAATRVAALDTLPPILNA
jgi:hypothetical protein